ncbi:MAG: DNA recombination protein RmuC [Proteobacteria bacterium]|nr:DNA recombination protein RmuC [Pseudomonadota bacterium]
MLGGFLVFTCLISGLALGAAAMYLYLRPRLTNPEAIHHGLQQTFAQMATQALAEARTQLLQLAETQLGGKQELINQRLATIQAEVTGKLEKVTTMVTEIDKQRHASFTTLSQQLGKTSEGLQSLQQTTADLKSALSNSRTRGQWGERMADDVLKLAGLQPNIQYRKQSVLSSEDGGKPRPDFTFLMPEGRVIHMDVKFPMDNYVAYLNAEDDPSRTRALKQFLADMRTHIRETSARDYRNAATRKGETTLDYILIFIPNEQIYAFLQEHDPELLADAVSKKVIPCSPTTLLAVLAVIHQAAHHFQLEQKSAEIFAILKNIRTQWEKFSEEMDKIGRKLGEAQSAFTEATTTRTRLLTKQFDKLDSLPQAEEQDPSSGPVLISSNNRAA